jgi:uncharacterized zinc-type alcohol dehydrogenase-like protein
MAVKLASAMGAEVTVFSTSPKKKDDATRLGAAKFVVTPDEDLGGEANAYHLIIDAVAAAHDWNVYINMLRRDGTLVVVGASTEPAVVHSFPLILGRRRISGSLIGGIRETQEMLDFCAARGIGSDVEVVSVDQINAAYDRAVTGDVRYRFVIDLKTL